MDIIPDILIPVNDEQRLKKLYEYQVLDTHPEDTFDKIATLASQIFDAPFAFLSFVDEYRVFFKANISPFAGNFTAREKCPCSVAVLHEGFTIFYDTHDEPYLKDSPLCADGGLRFYAAAPLKTPEGFLIGALSVASDKPRDTEVTEKELVMLRNLADIVVNKLESRLRYKKLLKSQNELMSITLHEIKNPLASIKLANEVIKKDPTRLGPMSEMIKESVARMQGKLQELLKQSQIEEEQLKLNIEQASLKEIIQVLINTFELHAHRKRQVINFEYDDNVPFVFIDIEKISDVFHNLLSNAIKYSYYDSTINISVKREGHAVYIRFSDQGQGLSEEDIEKLFTKFARLSAKPTGKETSNGLGLAICKSLVELHKGDIFATSEGKDKGATFTVVLPLMDDIEK